MGEHKPKKKPKDERAMCLTATDKENLCKLNFPSRKAHKMQMAFLLLFARRPEKQSIHSLSTEIQS
jgi:hypothetical protein